jgi:hypothetical protein
MRRSALSLAVAFSLADAHAGITAERPAGDTWSTNRSSSWTSDAASLSFVIPAERRKAREPGPRNPGENDLGMPGYLGPGSAAHRCALRCARDDSRESFVREVKEPPH